VLERDAGEMREEAARNPAPPCRGTHIEVLEVQPRPAEERRVVEEVDGEAHRLSVQARDESVRISVPTEKRPTQIFLRCRYSMREAFVLGELADETE